MRAPELRIHYLTEVRLDEPTAPCHHVLGLCRALASGGHRLTLVHPEPRLRPEDGSSGSIHEVVARYPRRRGGWALYQASITRLLRSRNPRLDADLVYLRFPGSWMLARTLRRVTAPKVLEVNGTEVFEQRGFPALVEAVDLVLAQEGQAEEMTRRFSRRLPTCLHKLAFHEHPATDPEHFRPKNPEDCRRRLGLPRDRKILLHVSSFQPHHDFETLGRAIVQLNGQRREWLLLLVGKGPQWPRVRRALAGLVPDQILMPGFVSYHELPTYLGAANLCLDVCRGYKLREGNLNGFKLLEYLAAERPALVSIDPDLPLPDLARDRIQPIPAESPDAVAEGARSILAAPRLWRPRCSEARRFVAREKSWTRAAASTLRALERVL